MAPTRIALHVIDSRLLRWLITCFMGMSHTSFDEVVANYNKEAKRLAAAVKKKLEGESQ